MFARVIRVQYPAHTSLINDLAEKVRAATQRELQNPKFLDTEIDCLGATLGGPITPDLPVDEYWFWNLRNTVRFDKAIAAALALGVDTFVELAEHPTLQLAIQENLAALHDEHDDHWWSAPPSERPPISASSPAISRSWPFTTWITRGSAWAPSPTAPPDCRCSISRTPG